MGELLAGSELKPYSPKYIESRLERSLSSIIIITEINGTADVVILLTTADFLLQELPGKQKTKPLQEKFPLLMLQQSS